MRRFLPVIFFFSLSFLPSVYCAEPIRPLGVRPESSEISQDLIKALRAIKRSFWATESGRHLLGLTEDIPVVEHGPSRGPMIVYEPGDPGRLVVDPFQAKKASELEFEIAFFIARQYALLKPPVALVDAALAARQALLGYVLEKARSRSEFAKNLRQATSRAESLALARKAQYAFAEDRGTDGRVLFPGHMPKKALDALGYQLYLFSEDPYLFYEVVAESMPDADAVSMTELEDFIEKHGERLDSGRLRALDRAALMEGRMYPGRLLKAAKSIGDREGLAMMRERLGPFDSVGRDELLKKINAWIREGK